MYHSTPCTISVRSSAIDLLCFPQSPRSRRHLEKAPIQYIQWRFQDGPFDVACYNFLLGEVLEKATRALTDEDKALLDKGFVGENGRRRKFEVSVVHVITMRHELKILVVAYHRLSQTEEVIPV